MMGMNTHITDSVADFDISKRFIRIINELDNGIVEFEFAMGEPEIFVEMILPPTEFKLFCQEQNVTPSHGPLPPSAKNSPEEQWEWTMRHARDHHAGS